MTVDEILAFLPKTIGNHYLTISYFPNLEKWCSGYTFCGGTVFKSGKGDSLSESLVDLYYKLTLVGTI